MLNRMYLFPHFLSSITEYTKALRFWEKFCEEIYLEKSQINQWKVWFQEYHLKPLLEEGEMIYSQYSIVQNKAFTIEQYPPERLSSNVCVREDVFGELYLENPIPNIRIRCVLSTDSAPVIRSVIDRWCDDGATVENIGTFLAQCCVPNI